MEDALRARPGWRVAALLLIVLAPLLYLLLLHGGPITQDRGYHLFADGRTCLGLPNFGNVASNLLFLVVGALGVAWCLRHPVAGARRSWTVFFAGVALVSFGSGYYHYAPGDESLVWDRLPMTVAFMGLFAALLAEHFSPKIELPALATAVAVGIGSVMLWSYTGDLRVYIWVQIAPFAIVLFLAAAFPGRHSHRHYLLYGVGFYAAAKLAEVYDHEIYALTHALVSGHTLKHLLAAAAAYCVYLMLKRRPPAGSR